jgi:hypothetical protein
MPTQATTTSTPTAGLTPGTAAFRNAARAPRLAKQAKARKLAASGGASRPAAPQPSGVAGSAGGLQVAPAPASQPAREAAQPVRQPQRVLMAQPRTGTAGLTPGTAAFRNAARRAKEAKARKARLAAQAPVPAQPPSQPVSGFLGRNEVNPAAFQASPDATPGQSFAPQITPQEIARRRGIADGSIQEFASPIELAQQRDAQQGGGGRFAQVNPIRRSRPGPFPTPPPSGQEPVQPQINYDQSGQVAASSPGAQGYLDQFRQQGRIGSPPLLPSAEYDEAVRLFSEPSQRVSGIGDQLSSLFGGLNQPSDQQPSQLDPNGRFANELQVQQQQPPGRPLARTEPPPGLVGNENANPQAQQFQDLFPQEAQQAFERAQAASERSLSLLQNLPPPVENPLPDPFRDRRQQRFGQRPIDQQAAFNPQSLAPQASGQLPQLNQNQLRQLNQFPQLMQLLQEGFGDLSGRV